VQVSFHPQWIIATGMPTHFDGPDGEPVAIATHLHLVSEQAEAALANAHLEFDRAKNLFEKGALAKQRLDAAETALRSSNAQRSLAQATLQQAEASARRAQEVARDATLTAPTGGVVVERNFDNGALVGPGDSKGVVVVADTRELKLDAGVSELEAGRLTVGMPATVLVQARPGQTSER